MEYTAPGVLDTGTIDLPPMGPEVSPPVPAEGPRVEMMVTPQAAASRRRADWRGLAGEVVQFTGAAPFEYRFQGQIHLLTSYERAIRSAGETWIDGRQVSTRHDFGRTLSFIPQGHQLKGSFVPRVLPLSSYFYIDPARLPADPELRFAETDFAPMLFFDDPALWSTTHKLMGLIESPGAERLYAETLGALLAVELIRVHQGVGMAVPADRGGLAAWQQRIACDYIEANLDRAIGLEFPGRACPPQPDPFLPRLPPLPRHAAAPLSHPPAPRACQDPAGRSRALDYRGRHGQRFRRLQQLRHRLPQGHGADAAAISPELVLAESERLPCVT